MVNTPNGNLINRAIQSLPPLELREDLPKNVEIIHMSESEPEEDAAPPVSTANPVEQGELLTTSSGGECIGNTLYPQQQMTRTGRRKRLSSLFSP